MNSNPMTTGVAIGPSNSITPMSTRESSFQPSDLANLSVWFNGKNPAIAINSNGSGGHPGIGGAVGYWPDVMGNIIAHQPNTDDQPTWETDGVKTSDSTDGLVIGTGGELNSLLDGAAGITIFARIKDVTAISGSIPPLFGNVRNPSEYIHLGLSGTPASMTCSVRCRTPNIDSPNAVSHGTSISGTGLNWFIAKIDIVGDEITIIQNGIEESSSVSFSGSTYEDSGYTGALDFISKDDTDTFGYINGKIIDIGMYSRVLNSNELSSLGKYLTN